MEETQGQKPFFLSVPFIVFIAAALIIGALQLSISDNVDRSPTGFVSIISLKEATDSGVYFDGNGRLKEEYVAQINKNLDGVPEYIFKLFGSDSINIYVQFNDGNTSSFNAITSSNRLVSLKRGASSEANIRVEITEAVLNDIVASDDPLQEFLDAFNSKKITYKGEGLEGAVKETGVGFAVGIIGVIKGIGSFFGGLFGR